MPHLSVESWVDGLNGRWTPLLFFVLGVFALIGQLYVGPVACNFPQEFTEANVNYGTSRCFTATNIAVLPFESMFRDPLVISNMKDQKYVVRTLYQFVQLLLIMQAIFLRIPYILWKLGEKKLGIHFSIKSRNMNDNTKTIGKSLALYLEQWIKDRKINILSIGAFTIFQLFVKLLYFLNVSTHLGLLDPFLKEENQTSFGSQVLGNIRENDARFFQTSPAFPREIMCEYDIWYLSTVQRYTVQCMLPFNPYLEQIMAVVWWWLIFLVAATVADGLICFFGAVLPCFRVWFVKSNLLRVELGNLKQTLTEQNISRFSNNKLGEDVIVFLKHIQDQENGCVVMETITELWRLSNSGSVQSSTVGVSSPPHLVGTTEVSNPSAPPYALSCIRAGSDMFG
ncbi:innexin-11-like [Crassostrea angulata]|uniref:innexin-11-like n=1 Tax=Magallana angulata TaxID=2784310 RepID=UPI0022B16214|nr:innexin-11-like [Crassostrea angulata]